MLRDAFSRCISVKRDGGSSAWLPSCISAATPLLGRFLGSW